MGHVLLFHMDVLPPHSNPDDPVKGQNKGTYKYNPSLACIGVNVSNVAVPSNVLVTPGMQHPWTACKAACEVNVLPHHRGTIKLKPFVSNCNKQTKTNTFRTYTENHMDCELNCKFQQQKSTKQK